MTRPDGVVMLITTYITIRISLGGGLNHDSFVAHAIYPFNKISVLFVLFRLRSKEARMYAYMSRSYIDTRWRKRFARESVGNLENRK